MDYKDIVSDGDKYRKNYINGINEFILRKNQEGFNVIDTYKLDGLAYYYEGNEGTIQREVATSFIVGNSILNAQGTPMCGEFDIKTGIAMLIMDRLNIGGSFAEFHPFDFSEDFILVGHDGPHHIAIANGKPILRSLTKFHGKPGNGASVEFKIKEGPITMLGITQKADGKFKFVIGEGISKEGPIPPTGNTNTRGFFKPTTREFVKKVGCGRSDTSLFFRCWTPRIHNQKNS